MATIKLSMRLLVLVSAMSVGLRTGQCDGALPTYCIYAPKLEQPNARPVEVQLHASGKVYFQVVSPRKPEPGDNVVPRLFNTGPEYVFLLGVPPSENAVTSINLRGTGGCLGVDYETDPPTVVELPRADKTSRWRFASSDEKDGWFIENTDPRGAGLWLSPDSVTVAEQLKGRDLVIESRKAVLSKNKMILTVPERPISK